MIQTINPYATARTAEIMSRYRPIAPKPEASTANNTMDDHDNSGAVLPHSIRKSPYLRNVWAHLQARPTRTRKRGRTAAFAPPSVKRTRTTCLHGLSQVAIDSPAKNLAMHGFAHTAANGLPQISIVPLNCGLDAAVATLAESVALPLIRCSQLPVLANKGKENCSKAIDLNMEADHQSPEELDFMPQLKEPVKPSVISPQPVRPVGSSVTVKSITGDSGRRSPTVMGAEEVEKEVEAEEVPAFISDSSNKVRLTNSAYKEMVGQPECCWLDCVAAAACAGKHVRKRIGGGVVLHFGDSEVEMWMHGFTCRVKIEWESDGKKRCVDAFCSAVKLACEAKDYQFMWRFHTNDQEAFKSASHII
ncbi:hypothetical protein BUALT_Bualt08G0044400 [Buddleja alternifolia]|uniref:DUF7950 domain-containing protein n=1 Tax=Buddleja alternifolia TaxID=168488 RepID=A0AAV6X313_9LAMI|nr:hypothetical protein BUALT_Bualt08G0044400 [Buddleja alternifolia]